YAGLNRKATDHWQVTASTSTHRPRDSASVNPMTDGYEQVGNLLHGAQSAMAMPTWAANDGRLRVSPVLADPNAVKQELNFQNIPAPTISPAPRLSRIAPLWKPWAKTSSRSLNSYPIAHWAVNWLKFRWNCRWIAGTRKLNRGINTSR